MYIKDLIYDGYKVKHATADLGYIEQRLGFSMPKLEQPSIDLRSGPLIKD